MYYLSLVLFVFICLCSCVLIHCLTSRVVFINFCFSLQITCAQHMPSYLSLSAFLYMCSCLNLRSSHANQIIAIVIVLVLRSYYLSVFVSPCFPFPLVFGLSVHSLTIACFSTTPPRSPYTFWPLVGLNFVFIFPGIWPFAVFFFITVDWLFCVWALWNNFWCTWFHVHSPDKIHLK